MARTDDDSWDITESVGATALGVAAGRAAETNSAHPLISDPYAQLFLDAAGDGIWSVYLREDLPAELAEVDPRFKERMDAMMGYTASRTLFFDEFFVAAAADGIRQAVILAAGLDARAWRLSWPTGSVVYEIDQPKVLAFKISTLEAHGVAPIATHVGVPIDLRDDWPAALRDAGFDPDAPPRGQQRDCCRISPRKPKICCSTVSRRSVPRAAMSRWRRSPTTSSAPRALRAASSGWNAIGPPRSSWGAPIPPSPAICSMRRNAPRWWTG
jgi:Leucine carboxyl methyltransferase